MARELFSRDETDSFILTVNEAAVHHGHKVQKVIDKLYEAVMSRLDFKRDTIKVYERNGELARTTWVTLKGSRYVFSYDYIEQKIDLRERTLRGSNIYSFDDKSDDDMIVRIINTL